MAFILPGLVRIISVEIALLENSKNMECSTNNRPSLIAMAFIVVALFSVNAIAQNDDQQEDEVALEFGVTDTNQYGRNYGRDNNIDRLNVTFTPIAGRNHVLFWQPYDIQFREMDVYLNDQKIRTVPSTLSNQLGSIDRLTVLEADLINGENILSFRLSGGNEKWGITNLRVETEAEVVEGEPASIVLLDAPNEVSFGIPSRSRDFNFSFTSRGPGYRETILISFDIRLLQGNVNGLNILLNGQNIKRISNLRGTGDAIPQSITLDKSQLQSGDNLLRISTTSSTSLNNEETFLSKLTILSNSAPLLDLAVVEVTISGEVKPGQQFEAKAMLTNLGAKTSGPNTVSFYLSNNRDMLSSMVLASVSVNALAGGESQIVTQEIDSPLARGDRYLWACIEQASDDINAQNNCSPVVQLQSGMSALPPLMLLLDD